MRRPVKWALGWAAGLVVLALLTLAAAFFVVRSDWFHNHLRSRMVAELERATGGEASIGSSRVDWRALRVTVAEIVIHGKEPRDTAPLLRIRKAEAGLKILSLMKRQVDLASLTVEGPEVHLIVGPDGETNLPRPKIEGRGKGTVETIFDLAVKRFRLEHGVLRIDDRQTPFSMRGEDLRAAFAYDRVGPKYTGHVALNAREAVFRNWKPLDARVEAEVEVEKNRAAFRRVLVETAKSKVEASAAVDSFTAPAVRAKFIAQADISEWTTTLGIREVRGGAVQAAGEAFYRDGKDYSVTASARASGVNVRAGRVAVSGAGVTTGLDITPGRVRFRQIDARALGGRFAGSGEILNGRRFEVKGDASGVEFGRALAAAGVDANAWSGAISGPMSIGGDIGSSAVTVEARLTVEPTAGGTPVSGLLDVRLDTAKQMVEFSSSSLSTPATQVNFTGRLNSQVRVNFKSTNLDDLLPAINLVAAEPLESMPVKLEDGQAQFEGLVTGRLDAPRISGGLIASHLVYDGRKIDQVGMQQITVGRDSLNVEGGSLAEGPMSLRFEGRVALDAWKLTRASAVEGAATLRDAAVSELLALAGRKDLPVSGTLAATAKVTGTIGDPHADADLTILKAVVSGERIERVQAAVAYSAGRIEVKEARVAAGDGQVRLTGRFEHPPDDFRNGSLQFTVSTPGIHVESMEGIQKLGNGLRGVVKGDLRGEGNVRNGEPALTALNGEAEAEKLQIEDRTIGKLAMKLATRNGTLEAALVSDFLTSKLHGEGRWQMTPGYPGKALVGFADITFDKLAQWLGPQDAGKLQAADGTLSGKADIEGPLTNFAAWKATLEISHFELRPKPNGHTTPAPEISLHNEGPLRFSLEKSVLRVLSAKLAGRTTQLELRGTLSFDQRNAWDIGINGGLDLESLGALNRDWTVAGAVQVNANVRGTLRRPLLQGRMELKGASLSVADVPNGLSNVNGVVIFSGTRATIQTLNAEVGGGKLAASGFMEFEGAEPTVRMQLKATQVRVRYPEGVSTQANADLILTGTTQQSLLSGDITVLRTGFTQRTDLSSILAKSSEPLLRPSARSGPLSGMQFEVRVETATDASIESNLAQSIQAEASLRLRGTAYNPVLLGRVTITQGEITFFGTKYTINQGSINFLNPVKLEPILNLDVETKVRGIDVILTFAGPLNKLTVTHRADPPLEFSEVVALLATGRTPTSDPTLAARQSAADSSSLGQLGASALVGQAIANPLSSRLQRFFGVSKLKIDPRLTGVENNPQARLTVEQQVTRNLTFTYITDLARSNQQIVRIEWWLNRQVSLVAVRDENGIFGVDALYKKSFR